MPGNTSTVATGTAATGAAAALVVVIVWLVSLLHVSVPADVATAFTVLTGWVAHMLAVRYGLQFGSPAPEKNNAPPPAAQ